MHAYIPGTKACRWSLWIPLAFWGAHPFSSCPSLPGRRDEDYVAVRTCSQLSNSQWVPYASHSSLCLLVQKTHLSPSLQPFSVFPRVLLLQPHRMQSSTCPCVCILYESHNTARCLDNLALFTYKYVHLSRSLWLCECQSNADSLTSSWNLPFFLQMNRNISRLKHYWSWYANV